MNRSSLAILFILILLAGAAPAADMPAEKMLSFADSFFERNSSTAWTT